MDSIEHVFQLLGEQYGAALKMLEDTIKKCDDVLWNDPAQQPQISSVLYHTLSLIELHVVSNESERDSFKKKLVKNETDTINSNKIFPKKDLSSYLKELKNKLPQHINLVFNNGSIDDQGYDLLNSILADLSHIMLHVGELHVRLNKVNKKPMSWISKTSFLEEIEITLLSIDFYPTFNVLLLERYDKALTALEKIIKECTDEIWTNKELNPIISQIVYHIIYFTDKYLNRQEEKEHKIRSNLGSDKFGSHSKDIFDKDDIVEYLARIKQKVRKRIMNLPITELHEPSTYPNIVPFNLSLILYNLRHMMLHIGAVAERLRILNNYPLICTNYDSFQKV